MNRLRKGRRLYKHMRTLINSLHYSFEKWQLEHPYLVGKRVKRYSGLLNETRDLINAYQAEWETKVSHPMYHVRVLFVKFYLREFFHKIENICSKLCKFCVKVNGVHHHVSFKANFEKYIKIDQ